MAGDDRRSVGVRVRPNSHDFVRQLRQDLAGKRYTYYVDVGAKTAQATADVRAWASGPLQKIHAAVPISANTGPATRDMADWRRRQAGIKTTVNVHADTSSAVREIETLRSMARDITVKVKADTSRAAQQAARAASSGERRSSSRSSASSIDKEFEAALKKGVSAANARLDEIRTEASKGIKVGLDIDPQAEYKLRQKVSAIAAKAKAEPIELPIEADIKELERQIMASKIIAKSNALKVPVEYDATDIRQMKLQLTKLRLLEEANDIKLHVKVSRSSLEQAKRAMDAVGKQFGSLSLIRSLDVGPLNLGKPSGLIGTVSTLTILAGLLPGVTAGLTAAADGIERLGAAAALAPGAIGVLGASLATLMVGTKGIGDAFTSLFALWDEGASQQGKSSAKMVTAQKNYNNAVVDEQRAQERVGDARRQALSDLRNLNNELQGGVLNEAQALLDLQKAKDRYAQGDFDNNTDRLQAQLDIQRAELNVRSTREDNLNLQQKANDANSKGVEGSDAVRDALDGQRRAAEATTAALEALNAGGAGATTAAQKFQDQLSQLSPNAQDFVMTIAGMKGELLNFRNTLQDTIFQGAGPAFANMFHNLLPVIQPGMEQIAQGLNQNMLQVFDTLQSPDGKSIIERILGGTAETQKALGGLIDPLVRGVGTLVAAGAEHMPQVVQLFTNLAERFAVFIDKADKSGALDKFLDKGVGALSDMAEIGLNLIQIVHDLSDAFGGNILTDIKFITDKWHEFLSSDEGQAKLKQFLQEAKDLWGQWKPIIMELPGTFTALSNAAHNVLDFLLPTIKNILGFLDKIPGSITVIATALLTSKLLGSFSGLARTVGVIYQTLGFLPGLINRIPGVNVPPLPGTKLPGGGKAPGFLPTATGTGLGGAATAFAAPVALAAIPTLFQTSQIPQDKSIGPQDSETQVNDLIKNKPMPAGVPAANTTEARSLAQSLGAARDAKPAGKWLAEAEKVQGGGGMLEFAKRWTWLMTQPNANAMLEDPNWKPPPSYMTGGYTDWGIKSGRMAELHGGEYVQPHPTVAHYGKDAMEAVHQKRAVIAYDSGGAVPVAYPGNDKVPFYPGVGGGIGRYVPELPGFIPGATGIGPWQSPFFGKMRPMPWQIGKPIISREGGGPIPNPDWTYQATSRDQGGSAPRGRPSRPEPLPGQAGGPLLRTNPLIPPGLPGSPWPTANAPSLLDRFKVYMASPFPVPGYEDGGLVYDPATGQYVQTGAAVSHGQNPVQGPGIIDSITQGVAQAVPQVVSQVQAAVPSHLANWDAVAGAESGNDWGIDTGNGFKGGLQFSDSSWQAAGGGAYAPSANLATPEQQKTIADKLLQMQGPGAWPATSTGHPEWFQTQAAAPGVASPTNLSGIPGWGPTGAAPGPTTDSTSDTGDTKSNSFIDSFLGSLGIPGVGGNPKGDTGPGWGPDGAPIGLGGGPAGPNGEAPFDIRNMGIGPGPPGSGPNNWLAFTGKTLGTFGSSLVTTFMSGILGGIGLEGLSSYISDATGIADHFLTPADKNKAQGPGADQTNASVNDLLALQAQMPGNPAYPGVPGLPNVFDPGTGSADPNGPGNGGLQVNTLRGKRIIQTNFPWATNIGGVRADNLKWHPLGLALDVMTDPGHGNNDPPSPEGLAKGNQLYDWLKQNQQVLGIDYIMWGPKTGDKDHYNHIHVNFAPSGYPNAASGPVPTVATTPAPNKDLTKLPKAPGAQPPPGGKLFGPGPLATMSLKPKGDPNNLFGGTFDKGGWLMPGVTIVHNNTGRPEWAGPVPSFAAGGSMPTGVVPYRPPLPRPPDAITKKPPAPLPAAPKPTVPAITPAAPPPIATSPHIGTGAPPGPENPPAPQGPSGAPINLGPTAPPTGAGAGSDSLVHTHPALSKAITSGFAAAGNVAATAASMGMGAAGGGMGGGAAGSFISGLFGQAGKIANNVANVASSFLVGNITGGTTKNPYGVTQRGNVPTGGTRVVDASNNQYGDVYTNNLDEYFKKVDRRNQQRAQSDLGRWGSQV